MNYELELETDARRFNVMIKEAHFEETGIRFTGFDPDNCPEELRDMFRFASKDLTAILTDESRIEGLEIKPVADQFSQ